MTTLFRLDASLRREGSRTRALADEIEHATAAAMPDLAVLRRDVGSDPLASSAWSAASAAVALPDRERTEEQRSAHRLASALADELEQADGYVFAAPLYNWGVSQHLKTWFDVVVTDPRFSPRASTIAGRPAVLVVARGGDYRPGAPRAEWDHASGWMRRVFKDLWRLDLAVVEVGLTLAEEREYMAHLRRDAEIDAARAADDARAAGGAFVRALAARQPAV
jgi:FMN-dependent NADH-azoreductase